MCNITWRPLSRHLRCCSRADGRARCTLLCRSRPRSCGATRCASVCRRGRPASRREAGDAVAPAPLEPSSHLVEPSARVTSQCPTLTLINHTLASLRNWKRLRHTMYCNTRQGSCDVGVAFQSTDSHRGTEIGPRGMTPRGHVVCGGPRRACRGRFRRAHTGTPRRDPDDPPTAMVWCASVIHDARFLSALNRSKCTRLVSSLS